MRRQFAERGGGRGNDGIDGADFVDGIKFGLVINWSLVGPIDIWGEWGVWLLEMEVLGVHTVGAVDGCGSTYAKDGVPAGFHHGIVGERHPTSVLDGLEILGRAKRQSRAEIGWVVVVTTNESNPVVGFRETLATSLVDVLVIAWLFEAKAAIARHDDHGIRHGILYAALVDKLREVAMDVATHHDAFSVGEIIHILYHVTIGLG